MKTTLTAAVALVLTAVVCLADDSDETLVRWLSRSDLVVLGMIVTEPTGITSELGVPNYICEFKVSDVCKGDMDLKGKIIRGNIKRFEMKKEDHHPLIKRDSECILFLKMEGNGTVPQWVTADFWFGIQQPIPWMVRSLKRLAKQETKDVEQDKSRRDKP